MPSDAIILLGEPYMASTISWFGGLANELASCQTTKKSARHHGSFLRYSRRYLRFYICLLSKLRARGVVAENGMFTIFYYSNSESAAWRNLIVQFVRHHHPVGCYWTGKNKKKKKARCFKVRLVSESQSVPGRDCKIPPHYFRAFSPTKIVVLTNISGWRITVHRSDSCIQESCLCCNSLSCSSQ